MFVLSGKVVRAWALFNQMKALILHVCSAQLFPSCSTPLLLSYSTEAWTGLRNLVVGCGKERGEKSKEQERKRRGDLPHPSIITLWATPDATLPIPFFSYNKEWEKNWAGGENDRSHWVNSWLPSAGGAAPRAQGDPATLPCWSWAHALSQTQRQREGGIVSPSTCTGNQRPG